MAGTDTSRPARNGRGGLVLGYGYEAVAAAQALTTHEYVPIAEAGDRLPHSRNAAGASLYDLLGPALISH